MRAATEVILLIVVLLVSPIKTGRARAEVIAVLLSVAIAIGVVLPGVVLLPCQIITAAVVLPPGALSRG